MTSPPDASAPVPDLGKWWPPRMDRRRVFKYAHESVDVAVPGTDEVIPIDVEMARIVTLLWRHRLPTIWSCQGGPPGTFGCDPGEGPPDRALLVFEPVVWPACVALITAGSAERQAAT